MKFCEVLEFFLRPENASIWAEVQNIVEKKDDEALHAYVTEAQRLTSTQRNMRVAVAPAELDGQKVEPGNAIVMLLVSFKPFQKSQQWCRRRLTIFPGRNWSQPERDY